MDGFLKSGLKWCSLFLRAWNSQLLPRVCPFPILSNVVTADMGEIDKENLICFWHDLHWWHGMTTLCCNVWKWNVLGMVMVVRRRKWAVARSAKEVSGGAFGEECSVVSVLWTWVLEETMCVCVRRDNVCVFELQNNVCVCASDCKYVLALFFWCGGALWLFQPTLGAD